MVMLPIELTTGSYMYQLNDDCLLEIFASNSLTLLDMCSLAETCTRFKGIAQRVFLKDLAISPYWWGKYLIISSKDHRRMYEEVHVKRILKNFGSKLSTLSIEWDDSSVVNSVARYCSGGTLKELHIRGTESAVGLDLRLKSICQRLLKFQFDRCDFLNCDASPVVNCDSLVELGIIGSCGCVAILQQTFPNLERFSFLHSKIYSRNSSDNNGDILSKFIERHEGLKTLGVHPWVGREDGSELVELLHKIGQSGKNLEKLRLGLFDIPEDLLDFPHLQSLTKLKTLHITFEGEVTRLPVVLLRELTSLEMVKIECDKASVEMFDTLSLLQNLRELHLDLDKIISSALIRWSSLTSLRKLNLYISYRFIDLILFDIVGQMTDLEELEFIDRYGMFELTVEYFYEILKMTEGRPQVLTLKCDFNFVDDCDNNRKVRLIKY